MLVMLRKTVGLSDLSEPFYLAALVRQFFAHEVTQPTEKYRSEATSGLAAPTGGPPPRRFLQLRREVRVRRRRGNSVISHACLVSSTKAFQARTN